MNKKKQQPNTTDQRSERSTHANEILDAWSGVSPSTVESMLTPIDSTSIDISSSNTNITVSNLSTPSYVSNSSSTTFNIPPNNLTNGFNNVWTTNSVDTGCVVYAANGEHQYLNPEQIQHAYTDAEWVRNLREKAEKYPAISKIYEQLLLTLQLTHNADNEGEENGHN